MSKERLYIFDTTLRDGAQTQGVHFSIDEKTKINIDENTIELKIKERENARKKGNYKLADDIRKELEENGISIEDKNNKTIWKYK